ncbi:MAG: hypothetical protein V4475_21790 [Pseudomonadota bacterium]
MPSDEIRDTRKIGIFGGVAAIAYIGGVTAFWWFAELPPACLGEGPHHRPTMTHLIFCSPHLLSGGALDWLLAMFLWIPALAIALLALRRLSAHFSTDKFESDPE